VLFAGRGTCSHQETTSNIDINYKKRTWTHQLLHTKQLPPLLSQLHRRHADFPPALTPADLLPQSASDDLMPETDSNQTHPLLLEHFLGELHQLEDPDVVVERVETCIRGDRKKVS